MKTCNKCGETKQLTGFHKNANSRDGLSALCKVCANIAAAAWQKANPKKHAANCAVYYSANKEKTISRIAKWREANLDRHKKNCAAWWEANPEARRVYQQNRRAISLGKLSPELAGRLFKLQRGKCACCRAPISNGYHLDHIMPLALGGLNTDNNIQLLCKTCNLQKHAKHPVDFMRSKGMLL